MAKRDHVQHIEAAQAAAQIERHRRAGQLDEARALLKRVLTVLGQGIEALQNSDGISIDSGLAFIYLKLNREELGTQYAQFALLNDPTDHLAHALLSEDQKVHIARSLMHHQRAESSATIFRLMYETQQSEEAAYYLSLMGHFDGLRNEISALPAPDEIRQSRRPLLMNIIVWGASYVESLLTYTFASLMAPGNIPGLAESRDVILDIFTTEPDRELITSSSLGQSVMQHAKLQFHMIPDSLLAVAKEKKVFNFDRWLIAGAQQCSALRAHRIGADLTFISSAAVYSANCLTAAAGYVDEGYQAVLTCPPRTMEPEPLAHLLDYAEKSGDVLNVDEDSLTRFIIDNIHPHCRNCFISSQPASVYQSPVCLFFKTPSGYVSRTFQTSPMLISHPLLTNEFAFDYLTVDARFVAELVRDKSPDGLMKVIGHPSRELVVTDVDTESGPGMKTYQGIEVSIDASATSALSTVLRETDLDFYEWALRQRFVYEIAGEANPLPDSDMDETETIENLIELIRKGSDAARRMLKIYEEAPDFRKA